MVITMAHCLLASSLLWLILRSVYKPSKHRSMGGRNKYSALLFIIFVRLVEEYPTIFSSDWHIKIPANYVWPISLRHFSVYFLSVSEACAIAKKKACEKCHCCSHYKISILSFISNHPSRLNKLCDVAKLVMLILAPIKKYIARDFYTFLSSVYYYC